MKNLCCGLLALFICFNLVAQNEGNAEAILIDSIDVSTNENVRKNNFTIHVDGGTLGILSSVSLNFEGRLFSTKSNAFHMYGRVGFGGMTATKVHVETRTINGTGTGFGSIFGSNNTVTKRERYKVRSVGGLAALTMLVGKKIIILKQI